MALTNVYIYIIYRANIIYLQIEACDGTHLYTYKYVMYIANIIYIIDRSMRIAPTHLYWLNMYINDRWIDTTIYVYIICIVSIDRKIDTIYVYNICIVSIYLSVDILY